MMVPFPGEDSGMLVLEWLGTHWTLHFEVTFSWFLCAAEKVFPFSRFSQPMLFLLLMGVYWVLVMVYEIDFWLAVNLARVSVTEPICRKQKLSSSLANKFRLLIG